MFLAQDLEQYFKSGDTSCEMLIAGFLYIIDFQNMFQVNYSQDLNTRNSSFREDIFYNLVSKILDRW